MTNPGPASESPSTRTLHLGIWGHISRRRRIQLGLLLVVMHASGGAELVSLGAVLAALIRLANLWLNGRLADQRRVAVGSDLSCEAYRRTLVQPYGVHVQRNSAAVMAPWLLPGLLLIDWAVALEAVLLFLAVLSASTPTEQEADGRGFPLSRPVHQPGGGVVPLIP